MHYKKSWTICIVTTIILIVAFGGFISTRFIKAKEVKDNINWGNKYLQEGKYEEAILAFEKSIKIDPKNTEARVEISKAYINLTKYDEAENILKEAININPKKVEPYLEIAKLYLRENKLVDAIKILTDGCNITNNDGITTMLEELKSKIIINDIDKILIAGENYSLPKEVTVKINNDEVQFPIKWDKTTVDITKVGTQKFNGILEDINKEVKLTLNIIAIASIENINNTIKKNDKYKLPFKVTANMTDNSTREVEVTWSPSTVDTSKVGTYIYKGIVNGYNNKIKLTLIVSGDITEEQAKEIVVAYDKTHLNIVNDWSKWNIWEETIATDLSTLIKGHNYYYFMSKGANGSPPYIVDKATGKLYELDLDAGSATYRKVYKF